MGVADDFKEFGVPVTERLRSPLIGSLFIAWSLWNFPVYVLMLTGDADGVARVRAIREYAEGKPCSFYVVPLVSAAVYVFGYPYLRKLVAVYVETRRKEERDALWPIHQATPVLPEEHERLQERLRSAEQSYANAVTELEGKHAALAMAQREANDLRKRIETLEQPPTAVPPWTLERLAPRFSRGDRVEDTKHGQGTFVEEQHGDEPSDPSISIVEFDATPGGRLAPPTRVLTNELRAATAESSPRGSRSTSSPPPQQQPAVAASIAAAPVSEQQETSAEASVVQAIERAQNREELARELRRRIRLAAMAFRKLRDPWNQALFTALIEDVAKLLARTLGKRFVVEFQRAPNEDQYDEEPLVDSYSGADLQCEIRARCLDRIEKKVRAGELREHLTKLPDVPSPSMLEQLGMVVAHPPGGDTP